MVGYGFHGEVLTVAIAIAAPYGGDDEREEEEYNEGYDGWDEEGLYSKSYQLIRVKRRRCSKQLRRFPRTRCVSKLNEPRGDD